jgi:mRNA-degrading endonuclease RelE of RelBE toxin-antitoxin system
MYRLELTTRAQRELGKLQGEEFRHILEAIQKLRYNPRPVASRKLRGPIHRIRCGAWRIIYAVFDKDQIIIVGKVAGRAEATYDRIDELF